MIGVVYYFHFNLMNRTRSKFLILFAQKIIIIFSSFSGKNKFHLFHLLTSQLYSIALKKVKSFGFNIYYEIGVYGIPLHLISSYFN